MPPQTDSAGGHDREHKPLVVLAALVVENVSDGFLEGMGVCVAGEFAGALRPVGGLVAKGLLAGADVNPSAFTQVSHPHTIIRDFPCEGNDWYGREAPTNYCYKLKSCHTGHLQVRDDDAGNSIPQFHESGDSVFGADRLETRFLQMHRKKATDGRFVVHE